MANYGTPTLGMDVAVYTDMKKGRPWVGRVLTIDGVSNTFDIHWYVKTPGQKNKYAAMPSDNESLISTQSLESVMLWGFTDDREESSCYISNYWLDNLRIEYEKLDK